jgi:carboxyl-terminal processing protease
MGNKKLGILFLVSVLLAFLSGYFSSQILPSLPVGSGDDTFEFITESFKNYYYYDIEDDEIQDAFLAAMEASVNSYAASNNDPYTRLVATPLNVSPSDEEMFIGIGISFIVEDYNLRVDYVYPQGAAVGLLYPNDLVIGIKIDDLDILFEDLDNEEDVLSYLSGELDDVKTMIVQDPDLNISYIDITYQEIPTPTAYAMDLGIGNENLSYIKINRFSRYVPDSTVGTAKVFQDALNLLETESLLIDSETKTLIIDMRDNPGGALTALHNQSSEGMIPGIAQQLLTKSVENTIFTMIPKNGKVQNFYGSLTQPKAYNIAVLVNEHSASAAEVLAAALKYYGGYELYGAPTYGKGVYQNQIRLQDIDDIRYSLTYTEGKWFYGDQLNVSTTPLEVNLIAQEGIKAINMPVYHGQMVYNTVSAYLSSYQSFLNIHFNFEGLSLLRTDGYFDTATKEAVERYQLENNLSVTGVINIETSRSIHDLYMEYLDDMIHDVQLQGLLDLLNNI